MSEYDHFLESRGIPLNRPGQNELGLKLEDELRAIDLLEESGRPLLGGDVYFSTPIGIQPAYANWSTSSILGETTASNVVRACAEARRYISNFPPKSGAEPLFVLVIGSL
jgi:hypothetical protein